MRLNKTTMFACIPVLVIGGSNLFAESNATKQLDTNNVVQTQYVDTKVVDALSKIQDQLKSGGASLTEEDKKALQLEKDLKVVNSQKNLLSGEKELKKMSPNGTIEQLKLKKGILSSDRDFLYKLISITIPGSEYAYSDVDGKKYAYIKKEVIFDYLSSLNSKVSKYDNLNLMIARYNAVLGNKAFTKTASLDSQFIEEKDNSLTQTPASTNSSTQVAIETKYKLANNSCFAYAGRTYIIEELSQDALLVRLFK